MIIPAHWLKVREKKIKDLPFENGIAFLINLLHQTNGCILPTLLKIELMFLEKIIKILFWACILFWKRAWPYI